MYLGTYARVHRDYLMRLARTPGASVSERSQSEYYASLIFPQLISKLQSLGALPTQPKEIVGDFYHHNDEAEKSYADLKGEIIAMETLALETGVPKEIIEQEIKGLKETIEKKEIEAKVQNLSQQIKEENSDDNPHSESN